MMIRPRHLVVVFLALGGWIAPGRISAQAVNEPEAVLRAVLLHLHTELAEAPAVMDLRDVCSVATAGICSAEFEVWLASLGMAARVDGSRSYCMNTAPPCADGREILLRLGVPEVQGDTATLRLRRWQPSRSGRESLMYVESELVLARDAGWRVERQELRWRS